VTERVVSDGYDGPEFEMKGVFVPKTMRITSKLEDNSVEHVR
jgi:hypothetical protein